MTTFISFSPTQDGFSGIVDINALNDFDHIDRAIHNAEKIYTRYISQIRIILLRMEGYKRKKRSLLAIEPWNIGNLVFNLKHDLEGISLEIDDLYLHVFRDTGIKRKRLEKFVILKRYVSDKNLLNGLNWREFEKGTKRKAQKLSSPGIK